MLKEAPDISQIFVWMLCSLEALTEQQLKPCVLFLQFKNLNWQAKFYSLSVWKHGSRLITQPTDALDVILRIHLINIQIKHIYSNRVFASNLENR